MKRMYVLMAAVILAAVMVSGASAQEPFAVWFGTSASDSTAIDTLLVGGSGAAFQAFVWASATVESSGIGVSVAFDTVVKQNKVQLATGVATTDLVWGTLPSMYQFEMARKVQNLAGGAKYGATLEQGTFGTAPTFGPTLVATLNLKANITGAEQYTIYIHDAGAGDAKTTVLAATDGNYYRASDELRLVVPEPGTLLALGSGLVGLAGFAIRRRK